MKSTAGKNSKKKVAVKKSKTNRKNVAASAATVLAKQNAEKTAQPGIISVIMSTLVKAKSSNAPVTTDEILAVLHKTFPKRLPEGMLTTVRAQLSRLPKEKDFAISKVRDGRNMRYAAA